MGYCYICGAKHNRDLGKCEQCDLAAAAQPQRRSLGIPITSSRSPVWHFIDRIPLAPILIGLALLIFIARDQILQSFFSPVPLASIPLEDSNSGQKGQVCAGKRDCLIVYVAPWCPACTSHIGFVNSVRAQIQTRPNAVVEVVVGMDERTSLARMANNFGGRVWLDTNQTFSQTLGIRSVPSWLTARDAKVFRKFGLPSLQGTNEEEIARKFIEYAFR